MRKKRCLSASGILFLIASAVFAFSYRYFHYAKENGLLGKTFHKKPNKPFVSMLFGVWAVVLLASSVVSLVYGLLEKE